MLKKIGYKLILLCATLFALNGIYNFTLFEKDAKEFAKEDLAIRNTQDSTDIYYFGESSNITYANDDSLLNSISEFCGYFYPSLKITNINKFATHAGVYRHWLSAISLKSKKPKAIIVTLNLRSFDAAWIHSKLETQLQQALVLTQPYPNLVNRFLLSLQAFDNKTDEQREKEMLSDWENTQLKFPFKFQYATVKQWDNGMANGGHLLADGTWDVKKIELACHFIKGFAFNLNEENPRIKDFDYIADWCNKNKVNLYLNLMAENINFADSLVGKELVFLIRQNRDYLVNRYNNNYCEVIDNLEVVSGHEFIDQTWTTEHYKYKARMKIAKNLANNLKQKFKKEYYKAY
jgi:hypothetical protein